MHDRSRIAACRGAFVVLCVLPTLLTAALITFHWFSFRSPAAKAEWERELSQRLGLAVSIRNVSYPRPNVAELSAVKFSDAETGGPLAECRRIEILAGSRCWEIVLVEPSIRREGLALAVERLHERLLASGTPLVPLRIRAAHIAVEGATSADSLVNLELTLERSKSGPAGALRASLPQRSDPIELRFSRNRQAVPPETRVEWNCAAPLPARWLAAFIGEARHLGDGAAFAGAGSFTIAKTGISGEFSGKIAGIDLASVVNQRFEHLLTGQATLLLERTEIARGRLVQARGSLVCDGGGRIGRSLLLAAGEHLLLTARLPAGDADGFHYERLAIGFDLTGERLRLAPEGGGRQSGVLVRGDSGPLLSSPSDHEAPTVALARVLLPESRVQVPAAAQTAALLRWLPLMTAQPPRTAQGGGHTPTRLGPAGPPRRNGSTIREQELR